MARLKEVPRSDLSLCFDAVRILLDRKALRSVIDSFGNRQGYLPGKVKVYQILLLSFQMYLS